MVAGGGVLNFFSDPWLGHEDKSVKRTSRKKERNTFESAAGNSRVGKDRRFRELNFSS